MRVLDLFSGIGGFSLGLERAGMRTVAFCEIDPFCRRVLARHWPGVPCYDDVRTLTAARLRADGIAVDLICGGFPCQDISLSGRGAGLAGDRSGLWFEYERLIREIQPRFVIVENVSALLNRGFGDVLGGLAALGYDAEWDCVSAAHAGAPTIRERLWICAFPECERRQGREPYISAFGIAREASAERGHRFAGARTALAGDITGLRTDHGFSLTLERTRIHGLGNAVTPYIPEFIGRAIMTACAEQHLPPDVVREQVRVG